MRNVLYNLASSHNKLSFLFCIYFHLYILLMFHPVTSSLQDAGYSMISSQDASCSIMMVASGVKREEVGAVPTG